MSARPSLPVLAALGVVLGGAVAAGDEDPGLPDGPGREETVANCGACHSLRLVAQQGLDRERWAKLLDWMVEEQGMWELEPAVEALILDYLARHVGPEDHKKRLEALTE